MSIMKAKRFKGKAPKVMVERRPPLRGLTLSQGLIVPVAMSARNRRRLKARGKL